jgi:hypothetical protein
MLRGSHSTNRGCPYYWELQRLTPRSTLPQTTSSHFSQTRSTVWSLSTLTTLSLTKIWNASVEARHKTAIRRENIITIFELRRMGKHYARWVFWRTSFQVGFEGWCKFSREGKKGIVLALAKLKHTTSCASICNCPPVLEVLILSMATLSPYRSIESSTSLMLPRRFSEHSNAHFDQHDFQSNHLDIRLIACLAPSLFGLGHL